jgi:ComF family protein
MAIAKVLAELLSHRLHKHYQHDPRPTLVLPVPLHWRRQWRRGFNQAHFLAAQLSRQLNIPLQSDCLARSHATQPQQGMQRRQRLRNLSHAFNVMASPRGRHIALVDDVVTTGATANLLSRMLLEHGAERVDVWCLARTPPHI